MSAGIRFDFHMHSAHSGDSSEAMETMIEEAIGKGLTGICFTEHLDEDFPEGDEDFDFSLDTEAYHEHFLECRDRYKEKIRLFFGVEYGLQPHLKERLGEYTGKYPFDMVIGSSHIVNGKDPYLPYYYEGRSEREAYLEYFENVLECVRCFDDFDVYGHLDYVVRYGPNKDRHYSYNEYSDIISEILKTIIDKGKGIEVNSGGFSHGLDHPNPREDVLKRYRELGGEVITVGSDAHRAEMIAYRFDDIRRILTGAGFKHITVFENRKPGFINIV